MTKYKCCVCGESISDFYLLLLHKRASIRGTGWGCKICSPEPDNALATVCNACLCQIAGIIPSFEIMESDKIKYAIRGLFEAREYEPIEGLENWKHDEVKHAMAERQRCLH